LFVYLMSETTASFLRPVSCCLSQDQPKQNVWSIIAYPGLGLRYLLLELIHIILACNGAYC